MRACRIPGTCHLSGAGQPELIRRFDRFLDERRAVVAALKAGHGVAADLDSPCVGVEQWKVDFLQRHKARQVGAP